ncbi:LysR family transcriptional regulator [Marinilongibacter aquaticus]|uniref:hydrogen peroxide-inducible genes activator n=1 Tax=Marinilongibacter aquaticus TaxID=2975157 RepID=UPI0021BD1E0C|nr:hydrogen peroxide-inducible genes activator [Marinilongibacter aquaticus]UBM60380.1 LysR family transcriptional regulator [Marinilongibacter aquaticus]
MTLNQISYIEAVARRGNFSKAAEECCVSQPALSMQVRQLEDELGMKIFDRGKNAIRPTPNGQAFIKQARAVLLEVAKLKEIAHLNQEQVAGKVSVGIIPTIAPYLLPLFIQAYTQQFPEIELDIRELTTDEITQQILDFKLDIGILATPLEIEDLIEVPLFYEPMLAYVSPHSSIYNKSFALPHEINPNELWLLEEGHCLRSQILKLCELKQQTNLNPQITFQAGSIETLIRLVDKYQGITILPELATLELPKEALKKVRKFAEPEPQREVSLVHHAYFNRIAVTESLRSTILSKLPKHFLQNQKSNTLKPK